MSVRKPVMFGSMYRGNIRLETAQAILQVVQQEKIESFRKTIFDFPIEFLKEAFDNGFVSIRKYAKAHNIDVSPYIRELRDYQTVGTAFLYLSAKSIIADGVGLGKTVEISALLNILKLRGEMKRFIMAVENGPAITQTQLELFKRTGMAVLVVPTEKKKMIKTLSSVIDWNDIDGIVIGHSALKSDTFLSWLADYVEVVNGIDRCSLFDTFILDESSVVKNRNTKVFEYTESISNLMSRVHFMNATTFETCIMDIYNQIDLLNPTVLPSKSAIGNKYCVYTPKPFWGRDVNGKPEIKKSWQLTGYKNQSEFKDSLKLFYFGRYIEDTKNEYEVHYVYPTIEQQTLIGRGARYQEVLNCPSLVDKEAYKMEIPFTIENVPKLKYLIDLVAKNHDKKIMIYCWHRQAQEFIQREVEKLGRTCAILNGAVNDVNERQGLVDGFNGEQYEVLITNIKKSLNLYDGDLCILYSVESNPAKLEQIRGRIERNVDQKVKKYIMIVYRGTGEFSLFADKLIERGKQARGLISDARMAVDYFIDGKHFDIDGTEIEVKDLIKK